MGVLNRNGREMIFKIPLGEESLHMTVQEEGKRQHDVVPRSP